MFCLGIVSCSPSPWEGRVGIPLLDSGTFAPVPAGTSTPINDDVNIGTIGPADTSSPQGDAVSPTQGTTYALPVTGGTVTVDIEPNDAISPDPVNVPVAGMLTVTIYDDDGDLGPGDTFTLGFSDIHNDEEKVLDFVSIGGTVAFARGSASIVDFDAEVPGQISAGGVGTIDPEVLVSGECHVEGVTSPLHQWMNGDWDDFDWEVVEVESFQVTFEVSNGIPIGATVTGRFTYHHKE